LKEINFESVFRNLEHVLFCEILPKKFRSWSALIGQLAVFTNIERSVDCVIDLGFRKFISCVKSAYFRKKTFEINFEINFQCERGLNAPAFFLFNLLAFIVVHLQEICCLLMVAPFITGYTLTFVFVYLNTALMQCTELIIMWLSYFINI